MAHVKPPSQRPERRTASGDRVAPPIRDAAHEDGRAHEGGRPHTPGTKLSEEMRRRRIKVGDVAYITGCSERQFYNYLTRRRPLRLQQIGPLCDYMDMDPDELVDEERFLLEIEGKVT